MFFRRFKYYLAIDLFMNEEIEITVFLKNPEEVKKILGKIAKFKKEKNQKDDYFVPKTRDFFQEKPTKEYLRIRCQEGKSEIAYHFCHFQKNGNLLKSDEYETEIKDPKTMVEILEKLGFVKKVTVTKHREYYLYKNFEICVDQVKELGCFLEVEAINSTESPEKTLKQCFKVLDEIGAKWEKTSEGGYPDKILRKMGGEGGRI